MHVNKMLHICSAILHWKTDYFSLIRLKCDFKYIQRTKLHIQSANMKYIHIIFFTYI